MSKDQRKLRGRVDIFGLPNIGLVTIRLEDESSRLPVVEISMTLEDFGKSLLGLTHRACLFQVPEALDKIGLFLQVKTEVINWPYAKPSSYPCTEKEKYGMRMAVSRLSELCQPFCQDGWQPDVKGAFGVQQLQAGKLEVTFRRYLPQPGPSDTGDLHDQDFAELEKRV